MFNITKRPSARHGLYSMPHAKATTLSSFTLGMTLQGSMLLPVMFYSYHTNESGPDDKRSLSSIISRSGFELTRMMQC